MATANVSCANEIPFLMFLQTDVSLLICAVLNCFFAATTTVGNLLIIISIFRSPALRSTENFLLLGLAIADFGVGVVLEPLYITVLLKLYTASPVSCTLAVSFTSVSSFLVATSMFAVTAISLDRYLAIHFHLRYKEFFTEKKVIYLQISLWITSGLLTLTRMASFRIYLVIALIIVIVCLSIICLAYCNIFLVLRRHQVQIQNQMRTTDRIKNLKQLRSSVVNTFYVFFAHLVCFLPFGCLTIIANTSRTQSRAVMLLNLLSTSIILFNSSLNPLIYCWRRQDFRENVKQTLKNHCCLWKIIKKYGFVIFCVVWRIW